LGGRNHTYTPQNKHTLSTWWSSPVSSRRRFKGATTNLLSYPAIRPVIMTNDLPENDRCPTLTPVSKCDQKHYRIFIKFVPTVLHSFTSVLYDGGKITKCSSPEVCPVEVGWERGRTWQQLW